MISNKSANKDTQENPPQNNSEPDTNEKIPKERYVSPEER